MTIKEAIEKMNSASIHTFAYEVDPDEWFLVFGLAIDALEKQIPMKPLHTHRNYYCPVCKEDGWMLWDDAVPNELDNFCGKCGQRLDWSNINGE